MLYIYSQNKIYIYVCMGNLKIALVPVRLSWRHYSCVIMGPIASQITSVPIVSTTVCGGADQRKYQSSASLAFVREFTGGGEFPAQRASKAKKVSIWWRHHEYGQTRVVHTVWPYGICPRNELVSQKVCYTRAAILMSIWNCLKLTSVATVALQIDKFTLLGACTCRNVCVLDFMISLEKIGFK